MVCDNLLVYLSGCASDICVLFEESDVDESDNGEVAGPPFEFVALECFDLTSELEGVAEIRFKCFSHVV